jgi:hypothetical protein
MKSTLRLAILLSLTCLPANAYETETGSVMICDTEKQVERFVQFFDGSPQGAISAVNAEENDPNACAMADAAYVQGPPLGIMRSKSDAFQIVPIVVVGVNTSSGYRPVKAALFFTLVKVKEFAV